jgi:hypothetical protein
MTTMLGSVWLGIVDIAKDWGGTMLLQEIVLLEVL